MKLISAVSISPKKSQGFTTLALVRNRHGEMFLQWGRNGVYTEPASIVPQNGQGTLRRDRKRFVVRCFKGEK